MPLDLDQPHAGENDCAHNVMPTQLDDTQQEHDHEGRCTSPCIHAECSQQTTAKVIDISPKGFFVDRTEINPTWAEDPLNCAHNHSPENSHDKPEVSHAFYRTSGHLHSHHQEVLVEQATKATTMPHSEGQDEALTSSNSLPHAQVQIEDVETPLQPPMDHEQKNVHDECHFAHGHGKPITDATCTQIPNFAKIDNQLNFDHNKDHTPATFHAIFDPHLPAVQDPQLRISSDMQRIVQEPGFLPPAKRRKIAQMTPMQLRTYSEHDKLPVIMASYGFQHCLPPDQLKEKGCFQFFFQDTEHGTGPRLLHPCEIAMIHGVTGRFFTFADFGKTWRFLGNQIAPFHALIALVAACQLMPKFGSVKLSDVYTTWDHDRLQLTNAVLSQGKAGTVLRHVTLGDDLTSQQHDNIQSFLMQFGKGIMPQHAWWDLDAYHDGTVQEPCKYPAPEVEKHASPMTQEEKIEVTMTQQFTVTVRAVMHQKTWKIPFWVASDATAHDLPALWNTSCEPSMQNGECHLFPCQQQNTNLDHKLVVFMLDKQMTIYQIDQEDFRSFCIGKLSTDTLYDTFGVLQDAQPYNQRTVITDHPIQHGSIDANTMYVLAAFQNCTVVYHYDIDKDHCRCTIRGDAASRMPLVSVIANAIDKNTLQALGRHVSICHQDASVVTFAPAELGTPVPPACFDLCLAIALTRVILDTIASEDVIPIALKWQSRPLWRGQVSPTVTADLLNAILMYSLSPITHMRATRLLVKGKQFASGTLQTRIDDLPLSKELSIFVVFECWGGAGPTATKTQLKQQVRNSVAAWMLEKGIELTWVHQHIEQCIDDIGVKRFVPVINQPACTRRDSQIMQLLQDASVKLPEVKEKPRVQLANSKAKTRKIMPLPEPTDFKLDCSFLLKEDGTPTVQLQEFRPNASGVFLTNEEGAAPWIRENQQLSTDELGMIVLGPLAQDTSLPKQQVVYR